MTYSPINPLELKVFLNHIYELKKGIRKMVLHTMNRRYEEYAVVRLRNEGIDYLIQRTGREQINLFFGRRECLQAIRRIITRPLNRLTPEEDFILGAILGYDLCAQCERYCARKDRNVPTGYGGGENERIIFTHLPREKL